MSHAFDLQVQAGLEHYMQEEQCTLVLSPVQHKIKLAQLEATS